MKEIYGGADVLYALLTGKLIPDIIPDEKKPLDEEPDEAYEDDPGDEPE